MASSNHATNRELQRDASAWADFTGTKYTSTLRQMNSPFAQGILGVRVSARQLIAALTDHPLVGAGNDGPLLGENGVHSNEPWRFNHKNDFIQLALITEMLRMFAPIEGNAAPDVSSYSLKHTAERFLAPHVSYVSNGRLIWAAATMGLPIMRPSADSPNVLIGVSEREHDYASRMVSHGMMQPKVDHYRPAGYAPLTAALLQIASGGSFERGWVRPSMANVQAPFHEWLLLQNGRNDAVGDFANDYTEGVRVSEHRVARTPDELLVILQEVSRSDQAYEAVRRAIAEWIRTAPEAAAGIRTERIGGDSHSHGGWGAGGGTVERYEYRCPCGAGEVVEEHDNIPGFREHDVRIVCEKCRAEWNFVPGKSVRDWALEPAAVLSVKN